MELKRVPRKDREERARHYLGLMGLLGFEQHYIWQLSGGMRQRVGLARALACEPQVLLMDEPFGALDALTRDVLQDHLLRIQAETRKTVVFVTHSVDEAIYLSDRIIAMGIGPGRVVREFVVALDRTEGREHMRSLPGYNAIHAGVWDVLSTEMAKNQGGHGGDH
jgi:NitT/TauT family transport system ATP-binding protein